MGNVAIVTDSNSGISQAEAKELGIYVIPMPFLVDGKLYFDLLLGEIDTKVQGKALRSLLKSLHLTQASYYRVRREAYDVLSMVLWGYSTRNMLGILQK